MSTSEAQIRNLIEQWAEAARNGDMEGVLAHHAKDIVMYDVPFPFQSIGIDAYRETWNTFFAWSQGLGVFDITQLNVVAGEDVAFCFSTMTCSGKTDGQREDLSFRLTVGLVKENGTWVIVHEHHSLPSA